MVSNCENKIRPLVQALNNIGIATIVSCEGHVAPRIKNPFPWVVIDHLAIDMDDFGTLVRIISSFNSISRYPWILVPKFGYTETKDDIPSLWLVPYEDNPGRKEDVLEELQRSIEYLVNMIESHIARR